MKPETKEEKNEISEILANMIAEIKEELGNKASINEIEEGLLKRQGNIMSRIMQHLVNDQDFPPFKGEI